MTTSVTIVKKEDIAISDISSIDKLKAVFAEQVKVTQSVSISNPFDEAEVASVKKIRKGYVTNRETIKRAFKDDRDKHTEHNRLNLIAQREITEVMEGEEDRLTVCITRAELEAAKEERKKLLPFRKDELSKLDAVVPDNELLELNDNDFEKLRMVKQEAYLVAEAVKIKEDQMRIEAEQAAEKSKNEEIAAEKERSRLALIAAEQEKQAIIDKAKKDKADAKRKAEAAKADAIIAADNEKKAIIQAGIDKLAQEKKSALEDKARQELEVENARKKEEARQKELALDANYKSFKKDNKFNENSMEIRSIGNDTYEIWTKPVMIASKTF